MTEGFGFNGGGGEEERLEEGKQDPWSHTSVFDVSHHH